MGFPVELLQLIPSMMGMGQNAMNTGLGMIPMGMSLLDRARMRFSPQGQQLFGAEFDRLNQGMGGNAVGNFQDIMANQQGAIGNMMGNNPAMSNMANIQQLSGMQRPEFTNSASGLAGLLGRDVNFAQSNPMFSPQGPDFGAAFAPPLPPNTAPGGALPDPSLIQQVINNPVAMGQDIQDQMFNQQRSFQDAQTANLQRRMSEGAAAQGQGGGGVLQRGLLDADLGRLQNLGNIRTDIGTEAARTNWQNRLGSANLQLGAEQALANQTMQENMLRQNAYNTDFSNMAGLTGMANQNARQGYGDQLSLWQNMNQTGQQGVGLENTLLDRARAALSFWFNPGSVSQANISGGGGGGGGMPPVPYGGWGSGGGGSASWPGFAGFGAQAGMS